MDVEPDGSLCRLTSSLYNGVCNVKIMKVSEEESSEVDYKLVLINEKKCDIESASEKSDEEQSFSLESLDIELGIAKPEKAKDKTEEVVAEKSQNKNTGNKPFNRRFRPNNMNRHRRNFKPYDDRNKPYNRQTGSSDKNDINPWLDPIPILNSMKSYQYGNYPQFSSVNTPVSANMDPTNPKCRGILGNSPFDYMQTKYQSGNVNHFQHTPNYWDREYPNNYQPPIQNVQMSGKPAYNKHHGGKFWKNKQRSYNRNQDKNQKRGRNGHFNYRQQ